MIKVGLVYTSTTPELIEMVEQEVKRNLGDVTLLTYEDASILAEIRNASYVTSNAGAKLVTMYMNAIRDGADAILNVCSSVGEVADAAKEIGKYLGVPIVRIDEEMCKDAVRIAVRNKGRIGVLATLPTTLNPTKQTIYKVARQMGQQITITDGLFDAFGANQETFQTQILEKAGELANQVDVILLCQGSMAYCETLVQNKYGLPVVSSPRYGALDLKRALIDKGLI